jgi:hypothetical protein
MTPDQRRLVALRRLATDPSATENERQVAETKASELETRGVRLPPPPPRAPVAPAPEAWPMGWGGTTTGTWTSSGTTNLRGPFGFKVRIIVGTTRFDG